LYDIIIAGAGVVGAFVARELSRYELKICILEKEHDVATGASKANSGIVHAGNDCVPGSLKALLNVQGADMMEKIAAELDVPFRKTGSLVVGFDDKDRSILQELLNRGNSNGAEGLEILSGDEARALEPGLSADITHALLAPSAGIISPYEFNIAAVENAVVNGAELYRSRKVTGISFRDGLIDADTQDGVMTCRYFVNAAGACAGDIAAMAGDDDISIKARKGEYLLLDKSAGNIAGRVIFQCPAELGKGVLVTPTADGNILVGPNAEDLEDTEDTATTGPGLEFVVKSARRAVPELDFKQVITSFAGIRAKSPGRDFIIRPSKIHSNFIHAAGIDSPGLTSAPAIGRYVCDILREQGLQLEPKKDFTNKRDRLIRFGDLSAEDADRLIRADPSYGRLVCRCEKVTEGEVIDSIRRPVGALDVDGVKRRTRAGMGRCQGGFCTPRIIELLSDELGIPYNEVTKKGGASRILMERTK